MKPSAPFPSESVSVPGHSQGGFVLVGVIMFVLALTILGISLFSLSGYESQFLGHSHAQTQVFYDAVSGIERTKYVLATSGDLDAAGFDGSTPIAGLESLKYARAYQGMDSTGTVDWADSTSDRFIRIRVVAERAGERMLLEATFEAAVYRSLYRDVIESTRKVHVVQESPQHLFNIYINGTVKHNEGTYTDWQDLVGDTPPDTQGRCCFGTYAGPNVPNPEVSDFIATWLDSSSGAPPIVDDEAAQVHRYGFNMGGNLFRIFSGPEGQIGSGQQNTNFGLSDANGHDLDLNTFGPSGGTVVWMLPAGGYFQQQIKVHGAATHNLILVAGVTPDTTYQHLTNSRIGLWLAGGIHSQGPRVFIISDGAVILDRLRNDESRRYLDHVTIFSAGVYLRGPDQGQIMQLTHNSSGDNAILGPLYEKGLLPNTLGRSKTFNLVPGSFQEITASNPAF